MSMLTRVVVACLLVMIPLSAQDSRAKVQGTIADSSGAVVAGANVTLINDETGIRVPQATGTTGVYLFDFVLPSTYTIQVEMTGFRTFVQKNVLVQARGDVTVDAKLELGKLGMCLTHQATTCSFGLSFCLRFCCTMAS